jgi:tRNA(fMet)-specific endonuclease VapC
MMLVDTSAWVDFFRGKEPMATAVDGALFGNEAALCGPVETELRRGLLNAKKRKQVLPLLQGCHWLDTPSNLWVEAGELGYALRRRGVTVKTFDLLIATYALTYTIPLLSSDSDFETIRNARVPLMLV